MKETCFENTVFRIDAEYFKKRFIREDHNRAKFKNEHLGSIAYITDGQHGYHEVDESSNISHLTAKNFKFWFADKTGAEPLAEWVHRANQRSVLEIDDVILTTRGSVGYCALVKQDVLPANIDQDVARIALKKPLKSFYPEFVVSYLNSAYGQDWVLRNSTGMVQQGLALWRIRELPIPIMSEPFQISIKRLLDAAFSAKEESKALFENAEKSLYRTLSLDFDILASQRGINASVRTLTGSFGVTGRLDAEFWQPAPALVEEKIRSVGAVRLGSWCIEPPRRGVQPDFTPHGGVFVVASKAVKAIGIELNLEEATTYEFWNDVRSAKARIQQGDVLLNGTGRGTLGRAGVYTGTHPALADNHVTILRLRKGINPFFVSLFLNSQAGLLQSEKWQAGSSGQLELYPFQIEQFLVPNFQSRIQDELGQYVENSLRARQDSIRLTEIAKRAVEIAIEESETAALHYLETNQTHYSPINSSADAE